MDRDHSILFALVLVLCSCAQPKTHEESKGQRTEITGSLPSSGLLLESGINRGMMVSDTTAITYIPITLENDTTIPIRIHIEFAEKYVHPHPESDEQFMIVPLPVAWTGSEAISDSLIQDLQTIVLEPFLDETIAPNDKLEFALGTYRPAPAKVCGIIPNELFESTQRAYHSMCDSLAFQRSPEQYAFGLKLGHCYSSGPQGACSIVPCGRISYP